jgi:2'-5' RNA ligase
MAKLASITLSPTQRFTYVPLPQDLVKKWTEVQERIVPAGGEKQEIDHITLVFAKKAETDIPPEDIDKVLKALREVGEGTPPIHAKVQGWGYFDGAMKDGETKTALVALVDAPGLETLHVEMKSALARAGVKASSDHTYTPHFTFCYLKQGERVNDLPLLSGEFDINRVCFANRDVHDIELSGSLGVKAASLALHGRL